MKIPPLVLVEVGVHTQRKACAKEMELPWPAKTPFAITVHVITVFVNNVAAHWKIAGHLRLALNKETFLAAKVDALQAGRFFFHPSTSRRIIMALCATCEADEVTLTEGVTCRYVKYKTCKSTDGTTECGANLVCAACSAFHNVCERCAGHLDKISLPFGKEKDDCGNDEKE